MYQTKLYTGTVETNGIKLYYEIMGEGYPLVLLHGGYMDRQLWDDQFEVFARHYQVIRYDIRGFGKSEMPPLTYSSEGDLAALLDHLEITHAYLLGLSWGGMIAIDFALSFPDRVTALILTAAAIGGFVPNLSDEQKKREALIAEPFAKATKERDVPMLVEAIMNHPTLVPSTKYPDARQKVRDNLSRYNFGFVIDPAPRDQLTPPAIERLGEICTPTLVIIGENESLVVRQMADRLTQDIRHAQKIEISDTRHLPNLEKPETFNQIVLGFLQTVQQQ